MDHEELHKSLNKAMQLHKAPVTDRLALMRYTDHNKRAGEPTSTRLNRSLASGTEIHPHDKEMHDAIMKHAKPSDHHYSVYSGTNIDAAKVHKAGEVHASKANISASHDVSMAIDHANKNKKGDVAHINHIEVKPHDKVLFMGRVSKHPMEHETVIPHGTKLKYTHTTHHSDHEGNPIDIHHHTIE